MSFGYMIYETERPKSAAEQRAADNRAGEIAASLAELGRSLKGALRRAAVMPAAVMPAAAKRAAGIRRSGGRMPSLAAEAAVGDGDLSVAELERLYSAPSVRHALDSQGTDGECEVRSS